MGQDLSTRPGASHQLGGHLRPTWAVREGGDRNPIWLAPGADHGWLWQPRRRLPALNRLDDVNKTIEQALGKFEGDTLHWGIYQLAFLKGNAAEMERQLAWAAGKPGSEDILLSFQ